MFGKIWGIGLPLLLGGLVLPVSASALTVSRVSAPVLYMDSGDSLYAAYAGYEIVNDGGTGYSDIWVDAVSFAGPNISLAPFEDGVVRLGAMAAGDTLHAYFYLSTTAATAISESHTIRVFEGAPGTGILLGSAVFGLIAEETISANSNKVTTAVSGPDPAALGGIVTVTVTGQTGTIGGSGVFSMTPTGFLEWPADQLQLDQVVLTMTGSANAGTYPDALVQVLPVSASTDYQIVYTFRITGMVTQAARFYPVQYVASGSSEKHTTNVDRFAFAPISPSTNQLVLSKTVVPSIVAGQDTVTYTVTLVNASPTLSVSVDEINDILPVLPGLTAYLPGTAAYDGSGIPDPVVNGQTLSFLGSFSVPAADSAKLTYDVELPDVTGLYTNQAVARIGAATQIDLTTDTADDSPATASVMSSQLQIGAAKDVIAGPVNNGDGTYTLTYSLLIENSGNADLRDIQITDDLGAAFAGAAGFSVDDVSVTAGSLTPDPAYTGTAPGTVLLAGTDTLLVGAAAALEVTITVEPGTALGPYNNSFTVDAIGLGNVPTSDQSTDGTVPDANANLDPTDDSAPTPVTFAEAPELGAAKNVVAGPVNNGDGTYTLTYSLLVENSGDIELRNLQMTDDLGAAFAGAAGWSVDNVAVTGGSVTLDPGYTGSGANTGLLAGADVLPAGAGASVEVTVTVTPGANLGPYANSATAAASSPGGAALSDASTNGSVPDNNGNGDPADDSVPTPVTFAESPELGAAKQLTALPVNNGDGTYTLTYSILVENSGDVVLRNLQITDNLSAAFAGASGFVVDGLIVTSGPLTADGAFTGYGPNATLLSGSDSLPAGASGTVEVTVTVTPGSSPGPYGNSALAEAASPAGALLSDLSEDGNVPDGNGNGDPADDSTVTTVVFTESPELGAAKEVVSGPVNNGDGTYTLTYSLLVENSGDIELRNLQLTDDLSAAFAAASGFTVDNVTVTGGSVILNPGYTGNGANLDLLAGSDVLAAGATASLEVTVTVTPGANPGPYANSATAAASSPGGAALSDVSTEGAVPDANGNGNPGDDNTATPVIFTENPELGAAKAVVSAPVNNGNGTFTLTYGFVIENSGDVELRNLQITDDLAATFAAASGFTVNSLVVTGGGVTANGAYTGSGANTDLLVGSDVLAAGGVATLEVTVTVTPGANPGPYANSAVAGGESPGGAILSDVSANGTVPDANGNGDPTDDSGTTGVNFSESPEIGAAKEIVSGPANNGDGTYTLTYRVHVENSGDVELRNLALLENLSATFGAASGFSVDNVSVNAGPVTANPGFTGIAPGTNLLSGTDVLPAGGTASVDVTVTVTPGSFLGPYDNNATAEGDSPGGSVVNDLSTQGSIPDANGNGNPADDSAPTPVTFTESPELGAAKTLLSGPVSNGDGTFTLTYGFVIENSGDVPVSGLQLDDDLSATFAAATSFTVNSLVATGGGVAVNGAYTGTAPETGLLGGSDTLAPGATATLELTVTVTPGSNLGPYANSAAAGATSAGGAPLNDISANGTVPDANGNGNPGDDSASTPVTFVESPEIGAAKRVSSAPVSNGDGTFTWTYSILVENSGDVDLSAVQIDDDLSAAFAAAESFSVDNVTVTSGGLTLNGGYTGTPPNTQLLAGTDILTAGSAATLDLTVTLTPGAVLGPYANNATVSAASPGGAAPADLSASGSVPDANGNGDPTDDSQPTVVILVGSPELGAAKAVIAGPSSSGSGGYTLTYRILVENSGDVDLLSLQIADDLSAAFGAASGFTVDDVTVSSGSLTLNPAYTGSGSEMALLAGTDTLPAGGTASVDVTLTVTPGGNLGPYANNASAFAASPSGGSLSDISTDGSVPDADGNGSPGNDSAPTVVTFVEAPAIGLAKNLTAPPVNQGDGTYRFSYDLTLENSGDVSLSGVELFDDLGAAFGGAQDFTVTGVTAVSGALIPNPGFTGSAPDTALLAGSAVLAAGASAVLRVEVEVTPGSNLGPYDNIASVRGESPGGVTVRDRSTDGTVPDPDGNGDPTDDTVPTTVLFTETAALGAAMEVSAGPVNNGDGTHTVTFAIRVENLGDVVVRNLQISDDLAAAWNGALGFAVDGVQVTSGTLTPDPAYTGIAPDDNLLLGTDDLPAGSAASLELTVSVSPGANPGPYQSVSVAAGVSPSGFMLSDVSTNGSDPDPDGDGNPGNDGTPTSITFTLGADAVLLEKTSGKDRAVVGEIVPYVILVTNAGSLPITGLSIEDRTPPGFSYVSGSSRLTRAGQDGVLGTADDVMTEIDPRGGRPLVFAGVALGGDETVRIDYSLIVGAGVVAGDYLNQAVPVLDGTAVGNTARAPVSVEGDPLFDKTTIVGKVFRDSDGDGWQDPTDASEVTVRGGFDNTRYEFNSMKVRRGHEEATVVQDRNFGNRLLQGFDLGELRSRSGELDPSGDDVVVIEALLNEPVFSDLWITTAEGTRIKMDPEGNVTEHHVGDKARGVNGQDIRVERKIEPQGSLTRWTLTISNRALRESGIPGVRVVSDEGLVMETDHAGRFHLADVDPGSDRGRNLVLKVDPATLPPGSVFTGENPRVFRVTSALMGKVNFGVQLPDPGPRTESAVPPGGGTLWATVDASAVDPRLDIAASRVAPLVQGKLARPVRFTAYCNYPAFIDRWELAIFRGTDDDLARPVHTQSGKGMKIQEVLSWDGSLDDGRTLKSGDTFFYVLRVYDAAGNRDQTEAKRLTVVETGRKDAASLLSDDEMDLPVEGGEIFGSTSIAQRSIPLRGSRVRIHGDDAAEGVQFRVEGAPVPRASDGRFAVEQMLPAGNHRIRVEAVDSEGEVWQRDLNVAIPDEHFFMVGIADLTVGVNDVSGHLEPLSADDRYDGDVYVDGRVAVYLKGKVKGKYLIGAHVDTQEERLEDMFKNIHRKDPSSVLRRLDPDRYYPVYGDESTTRNDAESQGRLYARVDWDRSSVQWGNYDTGITGTEFARYDRSLYGAKVSHQSLKANDYGQSQSTLTAFASEAQTALGHNEFLATGGSLYYLNHTDVVQGSEKVWVEVRDRDSDRVVENLTLVRYRDYEIDEIQGRIILTRPLTTVADQVAPSILKDAPLDGNAVLLLVDYEFVPSGFVPGQMTYGGRAKGQAGNVLGLGGTYAHENRNGQDYDLRGVDATLQAGKGTYVKAEYAESEAVQSTAGQVSIDGGLTFSDITPSLAESKSGSAVGAEVRVDLAEMTDGSTEGAGSVWWKRRDAGFSTARLNGDHEKTEYGGEAVVRPSERLQLAARAAVSEETDVLEDRRYSLEADLEPAEKWRVSAEGRRVETETPGSETVQGTLAGLRLGYEATPALTVYGIGQGTVAKDGGYQENNLGSLGFDAWVRDKLNLRGEGTSGNRGSAVRLGADLAVSNRFKVGVDNTSGDLDPRTRVGADWRLSDSHTLYGTFSLSPDRTEGRRSLATVGQRKSLSNQVRVFTENQFSETETQTGLTHVFGLDFAPTAKWTVGASVQSSNLDDASLGNVDRDVVSLSAGYRDGDTRTYSKLEYRKDRGPTETTQWLTANRMDYRVSESLTLNGKLSLSVTEDDRDVRNNARFVESGAGAAYRPVSFDRWQFIGKYTFLYDLPSRDQVTGRNDERMHVTSLETLFDVTRKLGVGTKVAARFGESRVDRAEGDWLDSRTYLFILRGNYTLIRNWEGLVEYRWLRVEDGDNQKHGALVAAYRNLSSALKAGVGFNFTHFTDDLTSLDYDNRGVFLNVIGSY